MEILVISDLVITYTVLLTVVLDHDREKNGRRSRHLFLTISSLLTFRTS